MAVQLLKALLQVGGLLALQLLKGLLLPILVGGLVALGLQKALVFPILVGGLVVPSGTMATAAKNRGRSKGRHANISCNPNNWDTT